MLGLCVVFIEEYRLVSDLHLFHLASELRSLWAALGPLAGSETVVLSLFIPSLAGAYQKCTWPQLFKDVAHG